jgi:hypothetical protein
MTARIRVLKIYDACNQTSAIRFVDEVIRRLPFRVLVVQTDNGAEFQSRFHWHLEAQDIRHVYIRPRTPHLNGKVERSHRVDQQEFYQLLDKDGIADDIHLFNDKLREWEDYYNYPWSPRWANSIRTASGKNQCQCGTDGIIVPDCRASSLTTRRITYAATRLVIRRRRRQPDYDSSKFRGPVLRRTMRDARGFEREIKPALR